MRFFTSDLHFGHANIIKYCNRPFADVDEMNYALIRNWNHVVAPDDEVIVLGDFAMGKINETLPIAHQLNGTKYLVPGNHDRCWSGHPEKKRKGWVERYEDVGFTILSNELMLYPDTTPTMLCHFPYVGDSHDSDRYVAHRPEDHGVTLLHGHVHDEWNTATSPRGTLMINVGVDAHDYRPVPERELL